MIGPTKSSAFMERLALSTNVKPAGARSKAPRVCRFCHCTSLPSVDAMLMLRNRISRLSFDNGRHIRFVLTFRSLICLSTSTHPLLNGLHLFCSCLSLSSPIAFEAISKMLLNLDLFPLPTKRPIRPRLQPLKLRLQQERWPCPRFLFTL